MAKWRIGSVCSGYNAPFLALERLGIDALFSELFACDIDQKVRKMLTTNFTDLTRRNVFGDVMAIDPSALRTALGPLDIFTAGFPCQPFSAQGLNRGTSDCRGTIIFKIGRLVEKLTPRAFILENVCGLVTKHREDFAEILDMLRKLRGASYMVTYKVMNSRLHSGLAHNRPRVYIVGIHRGSERRACPFSWPDEIPMRPLSDFLEPRLPRDALPTSMTALRNMVLLLNRIKALRASGGRRGPFVGDLAPSPAFGGKMTEGYIPCLTRARAEGQSFWLFRQHRFLTMREMLGLMGVPRDRFRVPAGISERQVRQMIGNSMDVILVSRIFIRLLNSLGFPRKLTDKLGEESTAGDGAP